ncbi:MAG: hypothetical protein J6A01_00460 [Proteobacteria bacterium]|nr:hypothetical protein [Pseudomonadota bacterium]
MISCKTFLSLNGQSPVECLPITANNTVSLCKTGVTSRDSAIASLQLDEHNELVVVRLTETPVTLERAGRKLALRAGKPIRICEKDTLWIDKTTIEIVKSTFVFSKPAPKSPLIQTARKVIAASAAVFSMAAFAACDEDGCDNGQQKCKNDGVYICANGSWNLLEKCGDEETCVETENSSASCQLTRTSGVAEPLPYDCKIDEMKCENNNVYKCDEGHWKLEKECSESCYQESNTSAYCKSEELLGYISPEVPIECTADEMKCKDNNVYKCNDSGQWTLEEECSESCYQESNTSAYCDYGPEAGVLPADPPDPSE